MGKNLEGKLPEFDEDLSPYNPQNIEAAQARELTFDGTLGAYVDEDGCMVRDEYGQPF